MGELTTGAVIALREYGPAAEIINAYLEGVRDAAIPEVPPPEMRLIAEFLHEASACAGAIDRKEKVNLAYIGQYSLACEALEAVNGHRPPAQALEELAQQASDAAGLCSINVVLHTREYPMFEGLHRFVVEIDSLHNGTEASIERVFSRN